MSEYDKDGNMVFVEIKESGVSDILERLTDAANDIECQDGMAVMLDAKDEIEALRQRVKMLESEVIANERIARNLENELAALKVGQGEPVAWMMETTHKTTGEKCLWISTDKNGWSEMRSVTYGEQIPLYTSAPTIPEGMKLVNSTAERAISDKLEEAQRGRSAAERELGKCS